VGEGKYSSYELLATLYIGIEIVPTYVELANEACEREKQRMNFLEMHTKSEKETSTSIQLSFLKEA
jgi:hypothetical protein